MSQCTWAVVCFLAVAGCAEARPRSPFTSLAKEPLQPGQGLGQLHLRQTTLGAFTRQYGLGESVVTSDQGAAQIDFIKDGLTFLFSGDASCAQQLSERMLAAPARADVNEFLLQNPGCEMMLLERIAVYVPVQGEPLYDGETIEGIGLNAARELAEQKYRATQDAVNALESGVPLPEPAPPNEIHYPGLRIYLGKDNKGREVVRRLEVIPR